MRDENSVPMSSTGKENTSDMKKKRLLKCASDVPTNEKIVKRTCKAYLKSGRKEMERQYWDATIRKVTECHVVSVVHP